VVRVGRALAARALPHAAGARARLRDRVRARGDETTTVGPTRPGARGTLGSPRSPLKTRRRASRQWWEARRRLRDLLLRRQPGSVRADLVGRSGRVAERDPRRPAVRGAAPASRASRKTFDSDSQDVDSTWARVSGTCGTRCSAAGHRRHLILARRTSCGPGRARRHFIGLDATPPSWAMAEAGGHRPVQDPMRTEVGGTRRARSSSAAARRRPGVSARSPRRRSGDAPSRSARPDHPSVEPTPRQVAWTLGTRSRCSSPRSCRPNADEGQRGDGDAFEKYRTAEDYLKVPETSDRHQAHRLLQPRPRRSARHAGGLPRRRRSVPPPWR
jgi:hypothetical protein